MENAHLRVFASGDHMLRIDYFSKPLHRIALRPLQEGFMTPSHLTIIAGIPIPSTSPLFLAGVAVHVTAGLTCVAAGAAAMLHKKGRGRHSIFGTVYFWSLAVVFVSATGLSAVRWAEDYPLFILATASFGAACVGRASIRRRAVRLHIAGMGASYILLLTAFYVDNGKNLPIWRTLPPLVFWLLPSAVGLPIIAYALLRHPLVRSPPVRGRA